MKTFVVFDMRLTSKFGSVTTHIIGIRYLTKIHYIILRHVPKSSKR